MDPISFGNDEYHGVSQENIRGKQRLTKEHMQRIERGETPEERICSSRLDVLTVQQSQQG